MLLPAIEAVWKGEHVNVLDADRLYRGILDAALRDVDDDALRAREPGARERAGADRDHPGQPVEASGRRRDEGRRACARIEVVDGSPRGLTQSRLDRARIVHIADSTDLALVAGSDQSRMGPRRVRRGR